MVHAFFIVAKNLPRNAKANKLTDYMRACLLILAILALQQPERSQKPSPDIEVEYDRFSDTTSVSLTVDLGTVGVVDLGGGSVYVPPNSNATVLMLNVNGVIKGSDLKKSTPLVSMSIISRSSNWKYLTGITTLRVILDERERFSLGTMTRVRGDVLSNQGQVIEQLALINIPFAAVGKISAASKVEIQIGLDEVELSPRQIDSLKEWVKRFPAPSRLQSPPK